MLDLLMTYVNNYKEVNMMPRMDGTGPMGCGTRTGWGTGRCRNVGNAPYGYGLRRGLGNMPYTAQPSRENLAAEKALLQERLAEVDKQLEKI